MKNYRNFCLNCGETLKILFYLRAFEVGGAETFIYNILSADSRTKLHIDFVLQSHRNSNAKLLELCKTRGCRIYYIPPFEKHFFGNIRELNRIIKTGKYDILHYHANALINIAPFISAKMCRCRLVVHSHNSYNNRGGFWGRLIHFTNRRLMMGWNIGRVACGKEAGKWMFGTRKFVIFNNAVDIDRYRFDIGKRKEIRDALDLAESDFVIGHVGRFAAAKNHLFLLDCFERLLLRNDNSKLVLVGNGETYDSVKKEIIERKISKQVFLTGEVMDCSSYYSAFDVMIFPSLYEGLPFTLIEAQASGLSVFASACVTREADATGLVKYLDLDEGAELWCQNIIHNIEHCAERGSYAVKMKGTKFDIDRLADQLSRFYNSLKRDSSNGEK